MDNQPYRVWPLPLFVPCAGDGAGVGKGRIIAGMIYQNYLEGRKQAVWWVWRDGREGGREMVFIHFLYRLSVSNDLKLDAAR